MKHKVNQKQPNSKSCLVCGLKNDFGLKASFYELENNEVAAVFRPLEDHQGYPGRLHGGITAAILDETIGRAVMIKDKNLFFLTVELQVKYKKPVPIDQELRAVGRITKDSSRLYEGTGEIILKNGEVVATGYGKYIKVSLDKMKEFDAEEEEWKVSLSHQDPASIEI